MLYYLYEILVYLDVVFKATLTILQWDLDAKLIELCCWIVVEAAMFERCVAFLKLGK